MKLVGWKSSRHDRRGLMIDFELLSAFITLGHDNFSWSHSAVKGEVFRLLEYLKSCMLYSNDST